jgi:hypothetical protein
MKVHCQDVEYRSLLSTNKLDHLKFISTFEDKINNKVPCITYPFTRKILNFHIVKVFCQDVKYRSLLSTNKHDHLNFISPFEDKINNKFPCIIHRFIREILTFA